MNGIRVRPHINIKKWQVIIISVGKIVLKIAAFRQPSN